MKSGPVDPVFLLITPGIIIIIGVIIWLVRSYVMNKSGNTAENLKAIIGMILFVIGGIPLLIYPGVLITSAMAFDSPPTKISIDLILILLWLVLALSYPVTYFVALSSYIKHKKLLYAFIPIIQAAIPIMAYSISNSDDYAKNEKGQYEIRSVNIYQNTPAWDLARAVRKQNTNKIAEIAKSEPKLLNYHDPIYGATLLFWAVNTDRYNAAEALLEAGADPNARVLKRGGETALHEAADLSVFNIHTDNDPKYVKLLLKYGANPDLGLLSGYENSSNQPGETPLMFAIGCSIEKTKALVEGGANINARTPTGWSAVIHALRECDMNTIDKEKYAHYLIAEKHADVTKPWFPDAGKIQPVTLLRDWTPDLNSEEHRAKMDIVKEFARQGVDYWKTEIPDDVVAWAKKAYPGTWQEYLKKY